VSERSEKKKKKGRFPNAVLPPGLQVGQEEKFEFEIHKREVKPIVRTDWGRGGTIEKTLGKGRSKFSIGNNTSFIRQSPNQNTERN